MTFFFGRIDRPKKFALKRIIHSTEIYPSAPKSATYINEIYTSAVYSLLKKVRRKAKLNGYLNPFVKGTIIFVKRSKESQPITILTESDISKLTKIND